MSMIKHYYHNINEIFNIKNNENKLIIAREYFKYGKREVFLLEDITDEFYIETQDLAKSFIDQVLPENPNFYMKEIECIVKTDFEDIKQSAFNFVGSFNDHQDGMTIIDFIARKKLYVINEILGTDFDFITFDLDEEQWELLEFNGYYHKEWNKTLDKIL